jgi:hypothetical protein
MTLDVDAIKAKLTEDELVHFYCIQLFMAQGPNIHLHAPLTGPLLNKDQCWAMAQEVMTTGHICYGDDPYFVIAAKFNPSQITGVMVEHKQSFTRKELADTVAKKESTKDEDKGPPSLADLLSRMQ